LSDALHERLTERFVDRRTSVLMRRLRENTMLNTEIGKTGEVIVEGHVIGRLDGFMFAPESAEAGSDAKALQATALKALAGEIDARAEKLANAPDDQFVLASDGTLRWTGDAVAKLAAADNVLQPRIRIIADERLTGAPRDAVQARLDLWLKTHIEKVLGPLFELSKAEDITGIARGIAFQLVEALGVLERSRIAAEMKDLDQPSRASLRKYGVRFGAYHIFLPALLKPAARGLASLLWALKHDTVDLSALTGAQHLAASGRTSFPSDKALDADAYRVLGYRLCGDRAIRVDILERLADLIRPALSWRPGLPGEKPAGAFDGRSFTATQAMTSLTGAAGEDFASILRALGYRMEKRPPLPPEPTPAAEPAAAETTVDAVPPEEVLADGQAAPAEGGDVRGRDSTRSRRCAGRRRRGNGTGRFSRTVRRGCGGARRRADAGCVPGGQRNLRAGGGRDPGCNGYACGRGRSRGRGGCIRSGSACRARAGWKCGVRGGRSEERRPRHHHRNRHHRGPDKPAAPSSGGEAAPAGASERPRHGRPRRDRDADRGRRGEAAAAPEGTEAGSPRQDKGGRPPRERFKDQDRGEGRGKGRFDKGKREGSPRRPRPRRRAAHLCDERLAARARSCRRSELALRQARRAQGPARRQPQGLTAHLDRQRIDKWLWHARVVKTRTDAAALVAAGRVRINGARQTAPGHAVKIGDVLTVALDSRVRVLEVIGFAARRGDAAAARAVYADLQSPPQ